MSSSHKPLRIGVSSCFFHADPERKIFKGKTLLYLEESIAQYLMKAGTIPCLLPRASGAIDTGALLDSVDGLLLQGGSDVSPKSYGEEPLKPEWSGDYERDQYEIELIHCSLKKDKPILGICRGLQIVNVAFGGDLYQDIQTQKPGAFVHRDWDVYDTLRHEIKFAAGSSLLELYPGKTSATINSVHHQAIKTLGKELVVEALSQEDDIIEAVRLKADADDDPYLFAVQWHPEFQTSADSDLLDSGPILEDFLNAVRKRSNR